MRYQNLLKKRAQCNGRPPLDPTLSPLFILPLTHTRSNRKGIMSGDFDIIVRNGHLIAPKNQWDGPAAIAVKDGLIAAIDDKIAGTADREIDAAGLYVTPGLIDIHMHAYGGYRGWLFPDQHALP